MATSARVSTGELSRLAGWQAAERTHIRLACHLARRLGHARAAGGQLGRRIDGQVKDDHLVTSRLQIARHGAAHVAQSDKADGLRVLGVKAKEEREMNEGR